MKVAWILLLSYVCAGRAVHDQEILGFERLGNVKEEFLEQYDDLKYEIFSHPSFKDHQIRIAKPKLCDPGVKQYSGYLDISQSKHLFFWFFESRHSPKDAPFLLWLNGGPGCSSSAGLLMELGPCNIAEEGQDVSYNPYSWTESANVLFLDQPVNVGFSYDDYGNTVNTSSVGAQDVYAFFQLFFHRFPEYSIQPFHVAGESYGGVYAPHIASVIYKRNKQLTMTSDMKYINLASVILANGVTDPKIQYSTIQPYACGEAPYPVLDPSGYECAFLQTPTEICVQLTQQCYDNPTRSTCEPASVYCGEAVEGPLINSGLNPMDIRKSCVITELPPCYAEFNWINTWMNKTSTKIALGVNPQRSYNVVNWLLNREIAATGEGMARTATLLPELINDGVRLLVYAGDADGMMTNYMGNERWVEALQTQFHGEFLAAKSTPWVDSKNGRPAGEVRSAGGAGVAAGNVTFVRVYEAGHMVPYDQPQAALDLITRWTKNVPLSNV